MTERLNIVPTSIDAGTFPAQYTTGSDTFAMTCGAMLWLDRMKIPYRTAEDFFDINQFRSSIIPLNVETEQLFSVLDNICESNIGIRHAYSGNILYFLKFFPNLIYLEKLARQLERSYDSIRILSPWPQKNLNWSRLSYSELQSIPQAYGLEKKINILAYLLKTGQVIVEGMPPKPIPPSVKVTKSN